MNYQQNDSYNDGILTFYAPKEKINSFGAYQNSRNRLDFDKKFSSFYKEETRRIQDYQFAEGLNHKLTLKVKIPYRNNVKSDLKIVIDDYLYELVHFDYDNKKRNIYLYLEGVGIFE